MISFHLTVLLFTNPPAFGSQATAIGTTGRSSACRTQIPRHARGEFSSLLVDRRCFNDWSPQNNREVHRRYGVGASVLLPRGKHTSAASLNFNSTLFQTPSWQWYYPYHFAPFAADFEDVGSMQLDFTLGQPFKPFEQLMGVFPAAR